MPEFADQVNVLAELERCGIKFEWAGDTEVRVTCPFHDDTTPSASVNIEKRLFKCHTSGCGASGDIVTLLAGFLKAPRNIVLVDLSKRYNLKSVKTIDASIIEKAHAEIWSAGPLLSALYARGVTNELIRKYRLGASDGRITIPIANEMGLFVNLRRYLPGAPGKDKMRNTRGFSKVRLYPVEQLKYDKIVLCGGEMKAIVAAAQLNPHGIGAITTTAGEGNWDPEFTKLFSNKHVWVCLDIDREGQAAAEQRCEYLRRTVSWLGNVILPLDHDKHPHGDVNDFVAVEKGDLKQLLDNCEEWKPKTKSTALDYSDPTRVELSQAMNAEWAGKRVCITATVAAMDTAPFIVPKTVNVLCDRSQKECAVCTVHITDQTVFSIHPESQPILEMVGTPRSAQSDALCRSIGIPQSCRVVEFETHEYFNIEDVRVSPQLEISNRSADRVMQPAMCVGEGLELNESYNFIGRMYPHPKTQQSTLLISAYSPTQDALSTYQPESLTSLKVFRPKEWTVEGVSKKLNDVYEDLEANVTRIFQRRDVHLGIDLAYHSPLLLQFDGQTVKGWVEVLIIGDSAQGKSETAINLMRHYGLGERLECKNATVAGLLGGLQQLGGRWFVTWGVIPTHDKRLVILEELKGTSTEVIAKLTDMRSSGIAEIPKIEKRKTHARTRLVITSNPRKDNALATYNFGIEAIKELVGGLEDIRRFDLSVLVSSSDIDPEILNQLQSSRPAITKTYTSDVCRELILWAWTRKETQVIFEQDAVALIMQEATLLCNEYADAIPLIDRGSTRHKLARLAASLAVRTFSSSNDYQSVIVRSCHVEFLVQHIRRCYSSPTYGYADFTAAMKLTQSLVDESLIKKRLNDTPFPRDFVKQSLHAPSVDLTDIQDWCSWDRSDASELLSFLVRKHALVRDGRTYRKTPPYIRLLKQMLENGAIKDRPDFIKEMRKDEF